MSKNWIADATRKKGKLHRNLGVPQDRKIPEATLDAAAKRKGVVGREARAAKNMRKK